MQDYVTSAIFVHTNETAHLIDRLRSHSSKATITPVHIDVLMADPDHACDGVEHAVVSGPMKTIKVVLKLSVKAGFSVGAVLTDTQKNMARFHDLPQEVEAAIDLALRADPMVMDLVLCNEEVVLFKVTMGRSPRSFRRPFRLSTIPNFCCGCCHPPWTTSKCPTPSAT